MLEGILSQVRIVEVGPRDGLQNITASISTEDKLRFVQLLLRAGVRCLELTSFVRPDWIPQLADASELVAKVFELPESKNVDFSCLVPNQRGLDKALELGVKEVAVFVAASEAFSLKNTNASIKESFDRVGIVVKHALASGLRVRGYLSTVFSCPYEGQIDPKKVVRLAQDLISLGVYEVSLGDTIGSSSPLSVKLLLELLLREIQVDRLALHFHDTRGLAIANILTALEYGVSTFDSSAGGLGGCPYAPGSSGNVATEDVLSLMEGLGVSAGIDASRLAEATSFIFEKIGAKSLSKSYRHLCSSSGTRIS